MNGKTATLLRRIAAITEQPKRVVKQMWEATPRNKRNFVRKTLKAEVKQFKEDTAAAVAAASKTKSTPE